MFMINPELLSLAAAKLEKSANMPPMDPAAQAMGAMPPAAPVDPSAQAMAALDPAAAMAAPAPPPAPATPAQPAGQKLKPEQMMQMLDYRLYNMQQQLTAIMNAMGVQVAPESLVLPPGTTGAPPAETALPGGPMAPPPAADPAMDPAAQGAAPAGDPAMDPAAAGAMPPADPAKMANWWDRAATVNINPAAEISLSHKAHAAEVLRRSRLGNAG
jgi:hypothetical protein